MLFVEQQQHSSEVGVGVEAVVEEVVVAPGLEGSEPVGWELRWESEMASEVLYWREYQLATSAVVWTGIEDQAAAVAAAAGVEAVVAAAVEVAVEAEAVGLAAGQPSDFGAKQQVGPAACLAYPERSLAWADRGCDPLAFAGVD